MNRDRLVSVPPPKLGELTVLKWLGGIALGAVAVYGLCWLLAAFLRACV